MEIIFKFTLEITDEQTISVPRDAVPLCVQEQGGALRLWVKCVPSRPHHTYTVRIFGTGSPVDTYGFAYVGTVQMHGFVWHVYISER